jgi:transcriptional regulator with XRE-family HTH domain
MTAAGAQPQDGQATMTDFPFREGEHYTVDPVTGCWNWMLKCDVNGYAVYGSKRVARWVYEMRNGPIPERQVVRHLCHSRRCINPADLAIGTHTDNGRDMRLAGRGSRKAALLSRDDVFEIVRRCELRGEDVVSIAHGFGVMAEVVNRALQGKNYHADVAAARQGFGIKPPAPPAHLLPGTAGRLPLYKEILVWRREQLGLRQRDVADALGCRASFISWIEGGYQPPQDHALLAAAFLELPETVMVERMLAARLPEDAPLYDRLFGEGGWLRSDFEREAVELMRMMGRDVPHA